MHLWIARARRMTTTDYPTAVEVVALAIWVEVALRVMPFSQLLQRLGRRSPDSPSSVPVPDDVHRLTRFVVVAYEILPIPTTCLRRSLVLHGLLERRAVRSRVCFGVARTGEALDAHAWIECDGIVIDEDRTRFRELRAASQFVRTSGLSIYIFPAPLPSDSLNNPRGIDVAMTMLRCDAEPRYARGPAPGHG